MLNVAIVSDVWASDPNRGHVHDVLVEGVTLYGDTLYPSRLIGFDAEHDIRHVTFRNVRLQGRPPVNNAEELCLTCNEYVEDVRIEDSSCGIIDR